MRKTVVLLVVMALLACVVPAAAQTSDSHNSMTGPPKVLQITREEVKPGKGPAHQKHEAAWTQAFVNAKYPNHLLTISSVTGPPEDWFLSGYPSFVAWEQDGKAMQQNASYRTINETYQPKESDFVNESRTLVARYRPEYSYKPEINLGEYRYFSVNIIRLKLGENADEFYKTLNAAREKANFDGHVAVYQVTSGMPSGTLITFTALKDMSYMDRPPNETLDAALKEANFSQLVGKTLMNSEGRIFAFNPRLSFVDSQVAAADPSFWNPKPVMAKGAPSGKTKPAAQKDEPKK